ncbi:effector-associated domain 2-containing protein [Embleya sp. AB8]|uniref:effector-associated domain 2-containing protein n=1 Tax=Embleya sp. AB8 TaxID=3156304 RepID=UPI003C71E16E
MWQVPGARGRFYGRDGTLVELRALLQAEHRVVLRPQDDLPGLGTTHLAREYAYRHRHLYDVVWWFDCAGRPTERAVAFIHRILEQLIELGDHVGQLVDAKHELHSRTGWLLVFDEVDRPGLVGEMIPPGPGHVLITSTDPQARGLGSTVDLPPLDRGSSVLMLLDAHQGVELEMGTAETIAAFVGDRPAAVARIAELFAAGLVSPEVTLELLRFGNVAKASRTIPQNQVAYLAELFLAVQGLRAPDTWSIWLDLSEDYLKHQLLHRHMTDARSMLLHMLRTLVNGPQPIHSLQCLCRALRDVLPNTKGVEEVCRAIETLPG